MHVCFSDLAHHALLANAGTFAPYTAIADTGASGCFLAPSAPCGDINEDAPPITVNVAGGAPHRSSAACNVLLGQLPVRKAHIMPRFHQNLLGIGPLCDAGCRVLFDSNSVTIFSPAWKAILTGWREPQAPRLWRVNLRLTTSTTP